MMFLVVASVTATSGPERVRRSEVAGSDVDDTILAPYVYRETAELKDP
jgi:hypothetical protein